MNEARIRERIDALVKERDELVQQANLRLAALNGAIQALEEMLEPEETEAEASE